MASSQSVWVKIEGEDDEKAEDLRIWAGMTASAQLCPVRKFAAIAHVSQTPKTKSQTGSP
jgi:hypothetical protein